MIKARNVRRWVIAAIEEVKRFGIYIGRQIFMRYLKTTVHHGHFDPFAGVAIAPSSRNIHVVAREWKH